MSRQQQMVIRVDATRVRQALAKHREELRQMVESKRMVKKQDHGS